MKYVAKHKNKDRNFSEIEYFCCICKMYYILQMKVKINIHVMKYTE